jgi:hypothetical protein
VWDVVIFRIPLQMSENRTAKIDGPMTFGYGIDATDSGVQKSTVRNKHLLLMPKGSTVIMMIDRTSPLAWKNLHGGRLSLISPFDPPEMHMALHARLRR